MKKTVKIPLVKQVDIEQLRNAINVDQRQSKKCKARLPQYICAKCLLFCSHEDPK